MLYVKEIVSSISRVECRRLDSLGPYNPAFSTAAVAHLILYFLDKVESPPSRTEHYFKSGTPQRPDASLWSASASVRPRPERRGWYTGHYGNPITRVSKQTSMGEQCGVAYPAISRQPMYRYDFVVRDVNFDIADPESETTIRCYVDATDRVVPKPCHRH